MKKLFLLFASLVLTVAVKAQSTSFHAFKVDLGIGYAIPTASDGSGTKAGVTFTVQPHYRITDALAVGVRFEGAGLGYENNATGDTHVKVSVLTSYCGTLEYYFLNGGARPFVGAGAGLFRQSASINSDNTVVASASANKFGFFPEAGLEAGHFRFSIDYNVMGNSNNYLAFKIGAFFGGGKK